METLIPIDFWLTAFFLLGLAGLAAYSRRPRVECGELRRRVVELEKALARVEAERVEYAAKVAGLAPEAARLLEAVLAGRVSLHCSDGRQAALVGGEVVCLGGDSGGE